MSRKKDIKTLSLSKQERIRKLNEEMIERIKEYGNLGLQVEELRDAQDKVRQEIKDLNTTLSQVVQDAAFEVGIDINDPSKGQWILDANAPTIAFKKQ